MRRGSALLVVLGMASFMLISAAGFAIYMRESRAPSSHLRREASVRYLLKSALANAMYRIDRGVLDDSYPGISGNTDRLWEQRVFMPGGKLTSPGTTVSTMTLESLAYLPPALINDVRAKARYTKTAVWENLGYDVGRYAFCAVDVSDCFDINRLSASERRTSASDSRITLAPLMPSATYGEELDAIRDVALNSKIPFVSMADFNIVAGAKSSVYSPFAKCINTTDEILDNYDGEDRQAISNALFITDTWFPGTNDYLTTDLELKSRSTSAYDLEGENGQPFATFVDNANFLEPARNQSDVASLLQKNIGGVGLACLYDYLDKNDCPISFVVPTVETAPMVCGVGLVLGDSFTPLAEEKETVTGGEAENPYISGATPQQNGYAYRWMAKQFSLTQMIKGSMMLTGLATFPFKRASAKASFTGSYKAEALVRIFIGPKELKSRLDASSPLYPSQTADWKSGYANGIISIKCDAQDLTFSGTITKTDEAVKQFTAQLSPPGSTTVPLFWKVWQQYKDPSAENPTWADCSGGEFYSMAGLKQSALTPYDDVGMPEDWVSKVQEEAAPVPGGTTVPSKTDLGTGEYVPHILVWVRITSNGKTVDVAPARIDDDGLWGGSAFDAQGEDWRFGEGTPVLEFAGDADRAFTYDEAIVQKLDGKTADKFSQWTELYAVDPRYNFAPENWFAVAGNGEVLPSKWLKAIGADSETATGLLGTDGRDRDIFMFTSDQEYLQSIGELAFLPNTQEMDGSGDFFENDYLDQKQFTGASFANRRHGDGAVLSSMDEFASRDFMWRTYSAFDNGDGRDPIYALRDGARTVEVVAGKSGFRVNPFSIDAGSRALMAALKDTPFDYTVASPDESLNKTATMSIDERSSYAFCEESTLAKLYDDELEDIASALRTRFNAGGRNSGDWLSVFCNMPWNSSQCNDGQKSLFGLDDFEEPLHGVDRKFLFSFWRECFQNRQQLFLVFVRAEPLTVGGSSGSMLAYSQLGARGVALVWRDPKRSENDDEEEGPHRMRILFYHQFD